VAKLKENKMKMNKHAVVSLMVIFFAISIMNVEVLCDKKKQESSDEQEKMIKLWKEYATPGENHKFLQYFVGQWESKQKIWLEPGTEPIIRHQEISVESLFGGRFTKAHIKIKEKIFGMSIEGIVITGYNNYKKQFVSVSYGNSDTEFHFMFGTLDKTGKVRTDTGYEDDFMTGERIKVKGTTTLIDNDKYKYEYYQTDSKGNEYKSLEIIYTRKK
jgi:hypothetical protein